MNKLTWCTDLHLDCIDGPDEFGRVEDEFAIPISTEAEALLITGDISTGQELIRHLKTLDKVINKPIYFVCGNHDFWNSDFESIRMQLVNLCAESSNLTYLTKTDYVMLSEKTAIVGHDGWYDAQCGDVNNSQLIMQDWLKIHDFINVGAMSGYSYFASVPPLGKIIGLSRRLAAEAANHFSVSIEAAAKNAAVVIIATHIPPWPQVNYYNGASTSPKSLPWYTSKVAGDAIMEVAAKHPQTRFEVFCGHTHSKCSKQIGNNVFCHVGGSVYGHPRPVGPIIFP